MKSVKAIITFEKTAPSGKELSAVSILVRLHYTLGPLFWNLYGIIWVYL